MSGNDSIDRSPVFGHERGGGNGGVLCAVQTSQVLRSELVKERMREIEVMRHSGREKRHHLSKATIDRVRFGFDNPLHRIFVGLILH